MSAIASFYLVPTVLLPELREAAAQPTGTAKRKLLGFTWHSEPWRDPFYELLHAQARELEGYHWSGWAFLHVFEFLRQQGIDVETFEESGSNDEVLRDRGIQVFAEMRARAFVTALNSTAITSELIATYVDNSDDSLPEDAAFAADAITEGLGILRQWLVQVDGEHFGFLSIG
jgi:hypothetical protein